MMVGSVAIFCGMENMAILNHVSFSDFSFPNSNGKFTYLTCKPASNITPHGNNMLRFGWKSSSKTIAYALPHENEGAEKGSTHQLPGDPVFICSDDDDMNSNEPNKKSNESLVQSGKDLQPYLLDDLLDKLNAIQLHILAMEQWNASMLKACHKNYSANAANLIHYLALKSLNMDQIKDELSSIGLLNLETVNQYVLSSLSACIQMLMTSKPNSLPSIEDSSISKNSSYEKQELAMDALKKRAASKRDLLLGKLQNSRRPHIMVTIGEEAIENDGHIPELIKAGTNVFRINCAHGDTEIWSDIITLVQKSSQHLEKPCRILMDLAGPKLRTGKLKPGPCLVKISPKRDFLGNLLQPTKVWLSPKGSGPPPPYASPDVILHVDGQEFLSKLKADDSVIFSDARGKRRALKIVNKYSIFSGAGFMAECSKTSYIESGTTLYVKERHRKSCVGFVVDIPPKEQFIRLRVGDLLIISRGSSDEKRNSETSKVGTHRITCPSGYLFDSVKPEDPIAFDDGKIWGVIKGTSISEVVVSITHAGVKGTKLGSEKSINIPESDIKYEGLTSKDIVDLDFVSTNADMVGVSFVRDVHDIVVLRQELAKRKLSKLGVVLKIETKGGFEKLPLLILEAMKSENPLGIMIARGDLAVECGWEKLADIQDEIFSICGAAHVPVVLATQVLESLVKSGVPSRAELTDAANGRRASCVMLNKGKNVLKAVSTLDTILNGQDTNAKSELKPLLLFSPVN